MTRVGIGQGLWAIAVAGLFGMFVGCSSSSNSAGKEKCRDFCGNVCAALEACDAKPTDCQAQCEGGVAGDTCSSSRPPDQLRCSELESEFACVTYCGELCQRAPSCGSFDSSLCAAGCSTRPPSICNPASVAARSCDQLKPELRLYDDIGRTLADGDSDSSSGGFQRPGSFGLCETGQDCEEPLGCVPATNTCGACEADVVCARDFGSHACSETGECLQVDCLTDDDCPTGVCDLQRHECVACRVDADCPTFVPACDAATSKCVSCTSDEHCSGATSPFSTGTRCDAANNRCEECLTNADCAESSAPRCEPELKYCTRCKVDADCKLVDKPLCDGFDCVDCLDDEDCLDGKTCDVSGTCI